MFREAIAVLNRAFLPLIAISNAMGQSHVVMNDAKVRVTAVVIPRETLYTLQSTTQRGSIWIALDDARLVTSAAGVAQERKLQAGDAESVRPDDDIQFRNENQSPAHFIIVNVKNASQELTLHVFTVSKALEDASDRNETLIVAVSPLQLRDIWNTADESQWRPSKPDVIRMSPGDVRWIRAGTHHFSNLQRMPAKFVFIEW